MTNRPSTRGDSLRGLIQPHDGSRRSARKVRRCHHRIAFFTSIDRASTARALITHSVNIDAGEKGSRRRHRAVITATLVPSFPRSSRHRAPARLPFPVARPAIHLWQSLCQSFVATLGSTLKPKGDSRSVAAPLLGTAQARWAAQTPTTSCGPHGTTRSIYEAGENPNPILHMRTGLEADNTF